MTHPSHQRPTARVSGGLPEQGITKGSLSEVSKRSGNFANGAGCLFGSTAPRQQLRVLDLFSGIGGFSLGLERTGGFKTVAFCEIEEFPRKVLKKHWPEVPIYEDVRTLTADVLERDGIAVDVITGGFPCQDISTAGKQAGIGAGTRSGLWSEIVRLARELRPKYVIVENVANLLRGPSEKRGGWFGRVLGDLAELGYDAEWENIPAAAVGAPHRRERVWIVAYPGGVGEGVCRGGDKVRDIHGHSSTAKRERHELELRAAGDCGVLSDTYGKRGCCGNAEWKDAADVREPSRREGGYTGRLGTWLPEPDVGRVAHGVPNRVDRLAALGNAVVPAVVEMLGLAIMEAENGAS